MTKKNGRLYLTFLIGALALSLVSAAMLYFSLTRTFNGEIRHFTHGSAFVAAMGVAMGLGAVLAVLSGAMLRKKTFPSPLPASSPLLVFGAALAALLMAGSAVFDFLDARQIAETTSATLTGTYVVLLRARGVLALLSAPYLALTALNPKKLPAAVWQGTAMLTLVWGLVMTLSQYFNGLQAINDPVKSLMLVLGVAFLLLLVAECRIRFGRQTPGALSFFLILSLVVGGGVSLSALVLAITGSDTFGLSLMNAALYSSLWLVAVARSLTLLRGFRTPAAEPSV